MTHTAFDHSLLSLRHEFLDAVTGCIIEKVKDQTITIEESRELAGMMLDLKEELITVEDIIHACKSLSDAYPIFKNALSPLLQKVAAGKSEAAQEAVDQQKLDAIQQQLSQLANT